MMVRTLSGTRDSMLGAMLNYPVVYEFPVPGGAELGTAGENPSSQSKMPCCFIRLNPSASLWLSKYNRNVTPASEALMSPEQNTIIFS